jgi:hypothetical protein
MADCHQPRSTFAVGIRRMTGIVTGLLLALALSSSSAVAQDVQVNGGTYHKCGVNGDAKAARVFELDAKKNRAVMPTTFHDAITATWIMQPSKDDTGRFDGAWAARIRLYVTNAKPGGKESVNCHATDPQYRDTHIEGNAVGASYQGQPMIVEVTPRWRAAMKTAGADWSTAALKADLVGHWVEFTGWMLEDTEHRQNSANAHLTVKHKAGTTPNIWRQTTWELHPVTSICVVSGPQ